jgi:hypothetical protein
MTGDATAVFCDATSNYELVNVSAFPNLFGIQLPGSVTCKCCSVSYGGFTNSSSSAQQQQEQQQPAS